MRWKISHIIIIRVEKSFPQARLLAICICFNLKINLSWIFASCFAEYDNDCWLYDDDENENIFEKRMKRAS